jgi:hypothetical protein
VNEPTKDHSPARTLSPEALSVFRASLERWVHSDGGDDSVLRSALHGVAVEARERSVRAEELLVLLKTTWYELGGLPGTSSGANGNKRLDDLVTACIKAYYA